MARIRGFALSILIASALFLGAANSVNPSEAKQGNPARTKAQNEHAPTSKITAPAQQPNPEATADHRQPETYNYYGNFNYVPPGTAVPRGFWSKNANVIAGLSTVFVAIFTGALVLTSCLQWCAIKGQAEIANNMLLQGEKAERAWIDFDVTTPIQGDGFQDLIGIRESLPVPDGVVLRLRIRYRWVNGGKTMGRAIDGRVRFVCIDPNTLPAEPNYGVATEAFPPFLVLPTARITLQPLYLMLNTQDIRQLFAGDRVLMVQGFLDYFDIFDDPHLTRICMFMRFPGVWPAPVGFRLGGPKSYNLHT